MDRYFIRYGEDDEKEVSKAEFIQAERNAGFRPKLPYDHPEYYTTFATAGFSGNNISGRIDYERLKR